MDLSPLVKVQALAIKPLVQPVLAESLPVEPMPNQSTYLLNDQQVTQYSETPQYSEITGEYLESLIDFLKKISVSKGDLFHLERTTQNQSLNMVMNSLGEILLNSINNVDNIIFTYPNCDLTPRIKVFVEAVKIYLMDKCYFSNLPAEQVPIVKVAILNQFVDHLRNEYGSKSYKSQESAYQSLRDQELKQSISIYRNNINAKFIHTILLDLYFPATQIPSREDEWYKFIDNIENKRCSFIKLLKHKYPKLFKKGIYKLISNFNGYSYRMILIFNHDHLDNDASNNSELIADQIGQIWRNYVNDGRGGYLNHNIRAPYSSGLGVIDFNDQIQLGFFKKALVNFCRIDQFATANINLFKGARFGVIDNFVPTKNS